MYLLAKFGGYRSHGNVDINSHINFDMIASEIAKCTTRSPKLRDFQNQEYRFTIPKADRKSIGTRPQVIGKRYGNAK